MLEDDAKAAVSKVPPAEAIAWINDQLWPKTLEGASKGVIVIGE